jgi:polyisoprenoid-binding protein YceI
MAASALPVPAATLSSPPRGMSEAEVRGAIVPERSAARYRVREQLAGFQFPNDAVGETKEISGTIALTSDGRVIAEQSRIVVDLRNLTSDEFRRDRYIKRNTLETDRFPNVTFVLREVRGLSWPPPTRGDASFQFVGDLTVQDQTRTVIWDTTAQFGPAEVTGTAKTAFTFSEFGLAKPRVLSVLSVDDTIRLELDFTVSRSR